MAVARILQAHLGLEAEVGPLLVTTARTYSHFRATTAVYGCRVAEGAAEPAGPWNRFHWLDPGEAPRYALTGATLQALRALDWLPAEPNT